MLDTLDHIVIAVREFDASTVNLGARAAEACARELRARGHHAADHDDQATGGP